jgi:RHH-type proline utilization regulon transcriptional repressor/proline dehydrogenase/delta 1-pyrroline-5-carboxylate dehydrogenase
MTESGTFEKNSQSSFAAGGNRLENRTRELGTELFSRSSQSSMNLFNKGFWSGKMMDWSMQNHDFKVQMFRFVDVLPTLPDADQIIQHLREYFLDDSVKIPGAIKTAMGVASAGGSLLGKIAASGIKKNVEAMAEMFIAGQDSQTAFSALEKLWKQGQCFTVDILGEAVVSEEEARDYQGRYLELVLGLAERVKGWRENSLEDTPWGKLPRANVSVKCSSLYSQIDPLSLRRSVEVIKERLRPILKAAVSNGVMVNLDSEQFDYRDIIFTIAEELFTETEFRSYPHFGVVVQAYLRDSLGDIERMVALGKKRGTAVTVRLVKGAYWDYEVIKALDNDWPVPVWTRKAESDAQYERCTELLLNHYPQVISAFASHNVRNLGFAMAYAEEKKVPKNAFEIQMLFGMADPFKKAIVDMGYRLRQYVPVGEILPGMAYLVRRLLENTSNEGFLRQKFVGNVDQEKLLADPREKVEFLRHQEGEKQIGQKVKGFFQGEPPLDFAKADNRTRLENALQAIRKTLPIAVPCVLNGKATANLAVKDVFSPNDTSLKVATYPETGAVQADEAAAQAVAAFGKIKNTSVETRIGWARALADKMRHHHFDLMALMMHECSKTAREADGDVAEAIDFCEYYAREMERLAKPLAMSALPGESNEYLYRPRGPALVIAPWNFPLAILCGMTVAPLLAGNPVIMKPAEQSGAIAFRLYEFMREAGIPAEFIQFLPGPGEVVGAALVRDPRIHIINFTGSRNVGLEILKEAAVVRPGQKHLKKVVCELGGKNALIVDEDADLDEAVLSTLRSAFGFQGQKCSAASRVIVIGTAYERFRNRIKEALAAMKIGRSTEFDTRIAAVIDRESCDRLQAVIDRNRSKVLAQLEVPAELKAQGYYVPATVFEESDPQSELGQVEFFGPLLTLLRAENLDQALQILNGVDYALTGGMISRSPENIRILREKAEVGNLYINRSITGSLVGRQPFGGFKLSGVGAKAGGPDYLLNFLEPMTHTENLLRRGFSPEL